MTTHLRITIVLAGLLHSSGGAGVSGERPPKHPHPVTNPASSLMLTGDWAPADHHQIDFDKLPRLPSQHTVVSDVRARKGVNQHNYLAHHDGRFWVMWSDGPAIEDRVGQVVKYSTSLDGVTWEPPRRITPYPPGSGPDSPHYNTRNKAGFRYISRGFWQRAGELLALVSLDEAAGFFGPSLELHAFRWEKKSKNWTDLGVIQDDAINNFPPHKLPDGKWGMSRRRHDYRTAGVEFLIGGDTAMDEWKSFPVMRDKHSRLKAEEPLWWTLPDGNLLSLFRDNGRGGYLYRAFSTDRGRSWTKPVKTDFPDATSKLHGLRLKDGRYVLVSNPHPKRRDPMTLAVSDDGLVFDKLFYLVGGRPVDYPHVLEHDGNLYIAHSGGKQSIEIERVRLADLNAAKMPKRKSDAPAERTTVLEDADWRQAPIQPMTPSEIDALVNRQE